MIDKLKNLASRLTSAVNEWVSSPRASAILPFLLLPPPMYTCFVRTWITRGIVIVLSLLTAALMRMHFHGIAESLEASGIDGSFHVGLGDALFVAAMTLPVAGMLVGSAWRATTPRHATLLAGAALVVAAVSAGQFQSLLADLKAKMASIETAATASGIMHRAVEELAEFQPDVAAKVREDIRMFMLETAGANPEHFHAPSADVVEVPDALE